MLKTFLLALSIVLLIATTWEKVAQAAKDSAEAVEAMRALRVKQAPKRGRHAKGRGRHSK